MGRKLRLRRGEWRKCGHSRRRRAMDEGRGQREEVARKPGRARRIGMIGLMGMIMIGIGVLGLGVALALAAHLLRTAYRAGTPYYIVGRWHTIRYHADYASLIHTATATTNTTRCDLLTLPPSRARFSLGCRVAQANEPSRKHTSSAHVVRSSTTNVFLVIEVAGKNPCSTCLHPLDLMWLDFRNLAVLRLTAHFIGNNEFKAMPFAADISLPAEPGLVSSSIPSPSTQYG